MSQRRRPIGLTDHAFGALLALAYLLALGATADELAMSRDESFYVSAAESYAGYFESIADDSSSALDRRTIDRFWSSNHEHPGLIKGLYALSWQVQARTGIFPSDSMAHRFPAWVMAGLLLWLIYIFGARLWGRPAGCFAALAFALMPRVFYHAHLNAFDVPIALMITLTVYCYWRSLVDPRWAPAAGLAFGLALATKHNSWVLPGIFAIHFGLLVLAERSRRASSPKRRPLNLTPYWLLAMLTLGPLVMVATWPWLWHETLPRLGAYARFHLHHDYYNMAYFGQNYFRPPFPISYPFVMTAFTVSLTILALAAAGLGGQLRALLPLPWASRLWPRGRVSADRRLVDVLLFGCLFAPLVIIALPSSPIFGGTKHWITAYPFLALYAGLGFMRVARALRTLLPEGLGARRLSVYLASGSLLLAPSLHDTIHSHPFGLSNYTFLAGGAPGAADLGMNREFWGFNTGQLAEFFTAELPEGGTVWICDTTPGAWRMMQRDGRLPENIRPASRLPMADYALVHHEHHFNEVDFQAWVAFGSVHPVYVLEHDGVPIISVYKRPRD